MRNGIWGFDDGLLVVRVVSNSKLNQQDDQFMLIVMVATLVKLRRATNQFQKIPVRVFNLTAAATMLKQ